MTIPLEQHNSDPLLRNDEAAKYLKVSPGTLRLSRHTGELFKDVSTPAYIKLGRAIRYRKSTLDNWLVALPEFQSTAEYQSGK